MKNSTAISTFLILMIATFTQAGGVQMRETGHTVEKRCSEAHLFELAACGCYVQAIVTNPSKTEIALCQRQFGADLQSLKPHCETYENGDGKVDIGGVSEGIALVQKICLRQLTESGGLAAVDRDVVEHTERVLGLVLTAILLLYAAPAF